MLHTVGRKDKPESEKHTCTVQCKKQTNKMLTKTMSIIVLIIGLITVTIIETVINIFYLELRFKMCY